MKTPSSRATLAVTLAVTIAAAAGPSLAQAPPEPAAPDLEALDRFIASELTSRGLIGLSAALVIDGKIVLAKQRKGSDITHVTTARRNHAKLTIPRFVKGTGSRPVRDLITARGLSRRRPPLGRASEHGH